MSNILYLIAVVLVVIWALGYFLGIYLVPGLGTGKLFHSLIILAIAAVAVRFLRLG